MTSWPRLSLLVGLLALVLAALPAPATGQDAPRTVRPGAPGEPSRTLTPGERVAPVPSRPTEADVRFMQEMIPHHAQALEMTALVPTRTDRREIYMLAQRIEVAQHDEIAWMLRWLQDLGKEVPRLDAHRGGHSAHHGALMPGMLNREEMARLANARGRDFDRLFLYYMIRHHEGALLMVEALLATPGAAQNAEVFSFASDVDADQRAELKRMRALLDATPPTPASPRH